MDNSTDHTPNLAAFPSAQHKKNPNKIKQDTHPSHQHPAHQAAGRFWLKKSRRAASVFLTDGAAHLARAEAACDQKGC